MPSSKREDGQHYWESPYIEWVSRVPEDWWILVFHTRVSRQRARVAAVMEALCLLRDLNAVAPSGGPLADRKGVFWIALPRDSLPTAVDRLARLGYSTGVDYLLPACGDSWPIVPAQAHGELTPLRWGGRDYRLARIYEEDPQALRESAPDRRPFTFEDSRGEVRPVKGYRGDGSLLGRRGLPVCDARLLVNLVSSPEKQGLLFLDPFAGAGGIVIEALAHGFAVASLDIDPALQHGLAGYGALHCVANASSIPLKTESIAAIATEPPYDRIAEGEVMASMGEMQRILKKGGRLAVLCAEWQAARIRAWVEKPGFAIYLESPIDRKGTPVIVLAMQKRA